MKDIHVYIISAGESGPIKVGISHSPRARLTEFQTSSPLDLTLVHSFPMPSRDIAMDVERMFHDVQKKCRVRGEWFDLKPWEAVWLLMIGIECALHYNCPGFTEEEMDACFGRCGIHSARSLLGNIKRLDA